MCDIYKYDSENYLIDGDMYTAEELCDVTQWHEVSAMLGSQRADQMKEFGFEPNEIVAFMDRVAKDAA